MKLKSYVPPQPIPAKAGVGLRAQHYQEVLAQIPNIGWFEVHAENYFGGGGRPHYYLEKIRQEYPLSIHGVGLSLGSADPLSQTHLRNLRLLICRYEPGLVSEHLSWSHIHGRYNNDLIPVPYTQESLRHFSQRISQVQEFLGRQILIENVSSYLQYTESNIPENEFINELAYRAGCGILLDINNLYVNAQNHGIDANAYLQSLAVHHVKEIHLAGHTVNRFQEGQLLIDSHDTVVCDAVWDLYREAVIRFPQVPVLIEWDSNLPPLDVLLEEAAKAQSMLENNQRWKNHELTA